MEKDYNMEEPIHLPPKGRSLLGKKDKTINNI
jgi:hypothetical protein